MHLASHEVQIYAPLLKFYLSLLMHHQSVNIQQIA